MNSHFYVFTIAISFLIKQVDQPPNKDHCQDCIVFCGLRDRKYPDKRAMGYPLDRKTSESVDNIDIFVKDYPNMFLKSMTIRHKNPHKVSVCRSVDNAVTEQT